MRLARDFDLSHSWVQKVLSGRHASTKDLKEEKTAFLSMYREACDRISLDSSPEAQRAAWNDLLQRHSANNSHWRTYANRINARSQWWSVIGE